MSRDALPCITCGKPLSSVVDDAVNHPNDGIVCQSRGNYGSTVFDPVMTGAFLEFNICDECLPRLAAEGKILLGQDYKQVVARIGPEEIRGIPTLVGRVPIERELVPWRPGLEGEGDDDRLVLDADEIGSELHPEVDYMPGVLEVYGKEPETAQERTLREWNRLCDEGRRRIRGSD